MPRIQRILEKIEIADYLHVRGLLKQYKKAKAYLLMGNLLQVRFRERRPSGSGIWYFRINRQFRALGVFDRHGNLIVFRIDNHQ